MICDRNFLTILSVSENIYKYIYTFTYIYVLKIIRLKFIIPYYDKKSFFAKGICRFNLISNP